MKQGFLTRIHTGIILGLLMMVSAGSLVAQVLEFASLEKDWTVCSNRPITILLTNTSGDDLTDGAVILHLPCGVNYVPGSVQGGTEVDLADLQQPVLGLPDLLPGQAVDIQWVANVSCAAIACLDAGQLFSITADLVTSAGTQVFPSDPFNVETARLVVTAIDQPYIAAGKNETVTRTLTVRNTRLGRLASFDLEDSYSPSLIITSGGGMDNGTVPRKLRRRFTGTHFQQIGNQDAYFDFNEEIVITEVIEVVSCAYEAQQALSTIRLSWGCGGNDCQVVERQALVDIQAKTEPGNLFRLFKPTTKDPICYDGDGVWQSVEVWNEGQVTDLKNVRLTIDPGLSGRGVFVDSVFVVTLGSDPDTIPIQIQYSGKGDTSCQGVLPVFQVTIPDLPRSKKYRLTWKMAHCHGGGCNPARSHWKWKYAYEKDCAPEEDRFYKGEGSTGSIGEPIGALDLTASHSGVGLAKDGDTVFLQLNLSGNVMTNPSGEAVLSTFIACGFIPLVTDYAINGVVPTNQKTIQGSLGYWLELTYPLPLPSSSEQLIIPLLLECDSLCEELGCKTTLVTSCTESCGGKANLAGFSSDLEFDLLPTCLPEKRPKLCSKPFFLPFDCYDTVCLDTLAGYYRHELTIQRTTLGLADSNNDGAADPGGVLDTMNLRLDRLITYDSFEIRLTGEIVVDVPGATYTDAIYKLSVADVSSTESSLVQAYALKSFGPDGQLKILDRSIRIFDSSEQEWYMLDTFRVRYSTLLTEYFLDCSINSLSELNSTFPKDFRYGDGDSIIIVINNRVDINVVSNEAEIFNIVYNGNMYLDTSELVLENLDPGRMATCDCREAKISILGLSHRLLPAGGLGSQSYCEGESSANVHVQYKYGGSETDFFPNEVRPTCILNDLLFEVDTNRLKLDKLRIQHQLDYFYFENISDNSTFYIKDFSLENLYNGLSWTIAVYYTYGQCVASKIYLNAVLRFHIYEKYKDLFSEELAQAKNLGFGHPNVTFEIPLVDLNAPSSKCQWFSDISAFKVAGTAVASKYNWVATQSPNGKLTNLDVINPLTGQSYPQINGIWQLTDIPSDSTLQVAITATNTSCDREELYVQYGWNCEPYTSLDQEPCIVFYDTLSVIAAPGFLELQPDPDTLSGPLCAPMPETGILFINADQGAVYDLNATVTLPKGLSYVTGSASIVWPAGSGNAQPVIDPQILVDGRLQWTLTDLLPELAEGLPGVNSAPDNSLELHFQTESDCDFVVGSRIITRFSGNQICGKPTNTSAKVSGPYSIDGVSSSYAVSIAVNPEDSSLCEDLISVNLTLNTSEIVGKQDKLILELPPGFSYLPGSCQTNLTPSEPVQQDNQLIWMLQEGLTTTTLSLSIQISEEVLCETVIIPIYTTTESSAFCVADGKDCSVSVITGSRYLPFAIDKPAYELSNLAPGWVNGQLVLTGDLFQTGGSVSGIGAVQVVLDENQNAIYDAGDVLIGDYPFVFTTTDSLRLELPGLDLEPEDWCRLLVVIDADANCACATTTATLDGPIIFPEFIQTHLCAGDSLLLGRPEQSGVAYQWLTKDLACTDCAQQTLQWSDPGSNAKTQRYWLRESRADGCTIELEYAVTMLPRPGFYLDSLAICQGDTATLLTSPGQQWTWSGPAQVGGGQQSLLVAPSVNSFYTVVITDDFGCVGVDTATVSVLTLPVAAAGSDTSFCFGAEARLQATLYPGLSYYWTNGVDRLSDPQGTDPLILLQEPYTYVLEVDNGQCRSTDSVAISFYDGFDIAGLPDTLRACLGDTAIFSLEGAEEYIWQPYYTWLCDDPTCGHVRIPVSGTATFTVSARNDAGCLDERSVVIQAESEEIWLGDSLSICAGGTVEIFGELVSEAGMYCDTTFFPSGCREVTCIQLTLDDGPETHLQDTICLGELVIFQGDTLTQSGDYCVTLSTTNGCDSLVCLALLASPSPVIEWAVDEVILCPGDSFAIQPMIDPPGSDFQWTDGYPALARAVVGIGAYTLKVTNACGQETERTFQADLTPLPTVVAGQDSTICEDAEVLVIPEISDGVVDWYWSDGILDLERLIQDEGVYILTVADTCQQEALDSLEIMVERCIPCPVEMPNVFSPNGDGVNDVFTFYTECDVDILSLQVFNRWGGLVYDGRGPDAGWNGRVDARDAPMDVYVYILSLDDPVDGERVIRGDVTLVR